ncbi:MAG: transglutaminase domain-containing protein [Phocaeicola sp.]
MRRKILLPLLSLLLIWTSCTQEEHFIKEATTRAEVETDFQLKQDLLPQGNLFEIFSHPLTTYEKEALQFIYAYLPIGDITDYSGTYYLENLRTSLQARKEMPWGKVVPDELFRHYVLPIRINNENLDDSRTVFYNELKERVKNLSLYDAVLEVNHWCHEKVIYTPSDARTSSPLASVRSAYGRCGEESTFTVAALRSVGIPARQVYTPRWAHTDDNHAWVEAWVDGKWYFLGACEPEPVLNLGWFNAPAYRGILMHTKVFGKYKGTEEILSTKNSYTEINVTENYTPTAKAVVKVVDEKGTPVSGADVEFKVYNYAEFYTMIQKQSNENGEVSLTAGKGDLLVWATKEGKFGYSKLSFGTEENIVIVLNKEVGINEVAPIDIVPPAEGTISTEISEEQKEKNAVCLIREDSIRNNYVASFCTEERAKEVAKELGVNSNEMVKFLIGSRGNHNEIENFIRNTPASSRALAMSLLNVISAKDLRDTPAAILANHLSNTPIIDDKLFIDYILNPRIANELITPYREFLATALGSELAQQVKQNPEALVDWVKREIKVDNELNPQRIPISPVGVWKARVADEESRNLFFIAAARSLGVAARIEPIAGKIEYAKSGSWVTVNFDSTNKPVTLKGTVVASYKAIKSLKDPKYYTHFTIAKLLPNGKLQTLNFKESDVDMGGGVTYNSLLKKPLSLEVGNYALVTGTRMANGGVLSELNFFTIEAGKTTSIKLEMRENQDDVQVLGSFNSENRYKRADTGEESSLLATTGRGYYIVAMLGSRQEPTNHAMRALASAKKELEEWGHTIVLLFPNEEGLKNFDANEFGELPSTITYGVDIDKKIQSDMVQGVNLQNSHTLPIFFIADTFNRVVFVSQGYTIGLGTQLLKVIDKL